MVQQLIAYVRGRIRRRRIEAEVDEELQFHIEMATEANRTHGLSAAEARRAALRDFGGVTQTREDVRQVRTIWIDSIWRDACHSVRMLRRSPAFTSVAVLVLALGIGFNTALFSMIDAVLFRPLSVERPDRLVNVYLSNDAGRFATDSYPDFLDLRSESRAFTDLMGFSASIDLIRRGDRPRLALGEVVTGNYFQLLGVHAELGRTLTPEDDRRDAPRTVVIADRMWRLEWGADPAILGQSLRIHGQPYVIVGVTPASFTGMLPMIASELWTPVAQVGDVEPAGMIDVVPSPSGTTRLERRGDRWMFIKGRLKPDVTIEQGEAELQLRMRQLSLAYPETNKDREITVLPMTRVRIHPDVDRMLVPIAAGLMAIVGMVLLIACSNVACLLLARGSGRQREIAIRLAIGASRRQLVQQLMTESLVLATTGAVCGWLLAWMMTRLVTAIPLPVPVPLSLAVHLDARVLWYTVCLTVGTALMAGLAPALQATRPQLVPGLKGDTQAGRVAGRRWTLASGLVAAQLALTTVLLVSAGLLTHSLIAAQHAQVGFRPEGLASVGTSLDMLGYSADRSRAFFDQALTRVRTLPGVTSAAIATRLPFDLNHVESTIFLPDRQGPRDRGFSIDETEVSAEYFSTLGVPIVRGRNFTAADTPTAPGVVIINEAMARKFWPNADAIGQRLRTRSVSGHEFQVVGIVAEYTVSTVGESSTPYLHFAYAQQPHHAGANIVARTAGDAGALLEGMRREMRRLEPDVVFINDETIDTEMGVMLLPARVGAMSGMVTGLVAMALAAIGLYGVMAYAVSRRTREIGIRLALGTPQAAVVTLVLRQGLGVAIPGIAVGWLLSIVAAATLARSLYHVSAMDPLAWGGAMAVVVIVSTLANLVPARRASCVDPLIALRSD